MSDDLDKLIRSGLRTAALVAALCIIGFVLFVAYAVVFSPRM